MCHQALIKALSSQLRTALPHPHIPLAPAFSPLHPRHHATHSSTPHNPIQPAHLSKVRHQPLIKVLSSQMRIPRRRLDLEHAILD